MAQSLPQSSVFRIKVQKATISTLELCKIFAKNANSTPPFVKNNKYKN